METDTKLTSNHQEYNKASIKEVSEMPAMSVKEFIEQVKRVREQSRKILMKAKPLNLK